MHDDPDEHLLEDAQDNENKFEMRQFNPKKIKDYIDKIFQRHTYHKSRKSHNHFGTPIKPSDVGSYGRRYVEDDENDFVDEVSRS